MIAILVSLNIINNFAIIYTQQPNWGVMSNHSIKNARKKSHFIKCRTVEYPIPRSWAARNEIKAHFYAFPFDHFIRHYFSGLYGISGELGSERCEDVGNASLTIILPLGTGITYSFISLKPDRSAKPQISAKGSDWCAHERPLPKERVIHLQFPTNLDHYRSCLILIGSKEG